MTVSIERAEHVWLVRHDRPEAKNAMDPQSADELGNAFEEFDRSDSRVEMVAALSAICMPRTVGW